VICRTDVAYPDLAAATVAADSKTGNVALLAVTD
jgi:hypothetical protein